MITGGNPFSKVGKRVELLFQNGSQVCELEPLPDNRLDHTQSGLITCGGRYTKDSCLIFSSGTWKSHGTTLKKREDHSSFQHNNEILLIGGQDSPNTTEIVTEDGTNRPSFNLVHPTK